MKHRNQGDGAGGRSRVSVSRSLLAAGFATLVSVSAWAAQWPESVASDVVEQAVAGPPDADSVARADWSAYMAAHPSPDEGCFRASYPSTAWERVPCKTIHPRVHPTPVHQGAGRQGQS